MNNKQNQHYQATHKAIQHALLSLLEYKSQQQISVRELCERAHIHRSTFYTHYESVYELLDDIDSLLRIDHIDLFTVDWSKRDDFLSERDLEISLRYVGEHKHFYSTYLQRLNRLEYLSRSFDELWEANQEIPFWHADSGREEIFYAYLSFMGGALKIVEYWLTNDCREPAATIAAIIARQKPEILR